MEKRYNTSYGVYEYRLSQKQLINYLSQNPCKTESQIQEGCWDYYRSSSRVPNKKYADLLRRALYSGKIKRIKMKVKGKDTMKKWYYFIPGIKGY